MAFENVIGIWMEGLSLGIRGIYESPKRDRAVENDDSCD